MAFREGDRVVTARTAVLVGEWDGAVLVGEWDGDKYTLLRFDNGVGGASGWWVQTKDPEMVDPCDGYEVDVFDQYEIDE